MVEAYKELFNRGKTNSFFLKMNLLILFICLTSGNFHSATDFYLLAATLPHDVPSTADHLDPAILKFLGDNLKKLEHIRDTLLNVHYALWRSG